MSGTYDKSSPVAEATRVRLVARFGALVDPWWDELPGRLEHLAARWELDVGEPVGRGNTSLVMRCRRAGVRAVLKLSPDPELTGAEARALIAWESSGRVPAVWACDASAGAVLLEAVPSETPLSESREPVATDAVAALIGALHASANPSMGNGFPRLPDRVEFVFRHWIERHGGNPATAILVPRLERGHRLARTLAADDAAHVLLHGDLHPGNVLDGGPARGLVAIDPRACVGDPAFDAVDWVFWRTDDPAVWQHRTEQLAAALGTSADRVRQWCAAFAALLAASAAARDGSPERIAALLDVAP